MIRFYTKSYDKAPTSMDKNYICTQGEGKKIINCAICGKVEVSYTYTVYKYNDKEFCSWNCKSKYRKAHPEEVELTESEKIVAKFMDVGDRYINNRTNVNLNKPPQPVAYVCYVDGVIAVAPYMKDVLVPLCKYRNGKCDEMFSCRGKTND